MRSVRLPDGLADFPPGPALAALLNGIDPRLLANADTVAVLTAQYRQLAHEQARLLEALVAVGRADPDDPSGTRRLEAVGEWASGEIAAALMLTGVSADRELAFADTVVTRLPMVHAALRAGALDRAKAWLFADHLGEVPADQAAAICSALVPLASGLTTGQLRARLVRLLHDIDPDHARRRYRRAVRERAVVGYLAPDGTVTVTATGLPTDEAAAACERLDALAHAIQRAGHPGRLGQIQTDLFLGMLDGTFHHLSEQQIVAALVQRSRAEDSEPDDVATEPDHPAQADHPTGAPAPAATTGVEIRVGLTTLLGLDERCGEVPGLGPVLPGVARRLVAAQHRGAEWRFAITDADGLLLLAGTTRRRPAVVPGDRRRCRGGIVELQIDAEMLLHLAAERGGGPWAGVIADLAAQFTDRPAHSGPRPGDRFARAALARHIEVRDRTCSFPGCRRPARKSDLDHTLGFAAGGPTAAHNMGPACGRHHRYKSLGWWSLAQPEPGSFRWTSPLSRTYRTRGEPIRPPSVKPSPRPVSARPAAAAGRASGPMLLRVIQPPSRRLERAAAANDEPPF
jgi:hypothetical protein